MSQFSAESIQQHRIKAVHERKKVSVLEHYSITTNMSNATESFRQLLAGCAAPTPTKAKHIKTKEPFA